MMDTKDKLMFEDITMSFASYVHSLAVLINPNSRARDGIDMTYREFKDTTGRLFTEWHNQKS